MTPLVSILTPSFCQATWLFDCLKSVEHQTYPNIEHIVMDGGSNDGSLAILASAGSHVDWRSEPDRGQAHAVNKAFTMSHGDIIGWLNSDDAYYDRSIVASVVEQFARNPAADVVYGHSVQVTARGEAIQVWWAPRFSRRLLRTFCFVSQPATFIRRSALNGFMLDETYDFAMDYELWLRLSAEGRHFSRLNQVLAADRNHPGRKSKTMLDVQKLDLERLSDRFGSTHLRWGPEHIMLHVRQRFGGAALIPRLHDDVAYGVSAPVRDGLWRRQIGSLRRHWPEEYR